MHSVSTFNKANVNSFMCDGCFAQGKVGSRRVNAYIGALLQSDGSNSNMTVLMCNRMVKISITLPMNEELIARVAFVTCGKRI